MAACFRHVRLDQGGSLTALAITRSCYLWTLFELVQIDIRHVCELYSVHLTPDDHAWLADIRTLARAEQFRRFQLPDREQAALAEFWPRQALLFEPNHAFNFGFLDYQETLKPHYQSHRNI